MPHVMVTAGALEVAVELHGPADGPAVVLLHGFPDDVRAWDGVAPALAARGKRVVVPYLRGYGPTRYRDPATPRSGQQAALGADLLALMDALGIGRALLAGYDWGGRAACIVAALWPERVAGLVSANGYNIQDIAASGRPAAPEQEARHWYQWYLHTERGVRALTENRRAFCHLLWRMWSPSWRFTEAEFAATAASWDNPDFVATVVQSYRHRHRAAPGDPALEGIEARLAARPPITIPVIVLHGAEDGVDPPGNSAGCAARIPGLRRREVVPGAGHFLPRETPQPWIACLEELGLSSP
ncbi:alpha/beta hydrolase [Roseomonas alkaliterrae]|uniref:Pimeloyl-ACP methyl ester carboxylesterase n=1 Tax=Neoroseomonas alkaliterrae TaxID=1452450 RepID=A0A840XSD2_9PROT|nr:alpha/beta hydrolase [Neoroseomonas alkaliterrae]MBB5690836.1 pimeloyl-ACP methyl ester carboxylesterase [Neoroseomonas alkaliterrae]MBR0677814.1 alpha/beta hydrolase [Neoroseomonas alkaliterrae]